MIHPETLQASRAVFMWITGSHWPTDCQNKQTNSLLYAQITKVTYMSRGVKRPENRGSVTKKQHLSRPEVLSDPKIAGQLRKNSSGHTTQFFFKKSRIFLIPAIMTKNLWVCTKQQQIHTIMTKNLWVCAKLQHSHLRTVKKNRYQLGAWFLVGLSS